MSCRGPDLPSNVFHQILYSIMRTSNVMIMIYGQQKTDSSCRNHPGTERKYCVSSSNVRICGQTVLKGKRLWQLVLVPGISHRPQLRLWCGH
jgi:hypothetical protein